MKKDFLKILLFVSLAIVVFLVLYLNQTHGFFIISTPTFNETYVSFRFDDGLKSQMQAFYILEKYNMTGSVYIITSKPDSDITWEKQYYLNWSEIRNISSFLEVGSHTITHINLITYADADKEIIESKDNLIKQGFNVSTFVYPGGNYNKRVIDLVNENYECASTQDVGTNFLPIRPHLLKDFTFRSGNTNAAIPRVIKEGKWNILTFHDIGILNDSNMPKLYYNIAQENAISPEYFESIVKYVKEKNITVITIKEGCDMFNR